MIAGWLAAFALGWTGGRVDRWTGEQQQASASSLNSMTLFPTPDLAASGTIALRPVPSPFGVAVTVDGRPRYHLVADIAGLPDPHSLGSYSAYVAWAYTLGLDSAVKLGAVRNGHVDLGELDYVQFRILISAERSPGVARRSGRLVLRETSPSARLLAHRDLTTPVSPGVLRAASPSSMGEMTDRSMQHDVEPSAGPPVHRSTGPPISWRMAPMPRRLAMMPGMRGLSPNTSPYLPATTTATRDLSRTIRLRDGDTVNLSPRTIETTIAGKPVTMLAYNGMLPGPRLEVPQGARITARVTNTFDAATSIHWHGIRLDNAFDGAVGLTQSAIEPGGSLAYSVRFPDAGFYWYHSHAREDVQQGLGLYGTILVRSADPNYYSAVNREEVLVLSDVLMDERGLIPFGAGEATHALMGRFGSVLLVNGETGYSLMVDRGSVVRFFIANAANARVYNLSFSDPRARMRVVAGDGGKFEHEEWVESVVIGPSERYVVEARFPAAGKVALVNRVQALDHMIGSYSRETDTLGVVTVSDKAAAPSRARSFAELRSNRDVASPLAPFRSAFDRPVDHELVLTMHRSGRHYPRLRQMGRDDSAWNAGRSRRHRRRSGRDAGGHSKDGDRISSRDRVRFGEAAGVGEGNGGPAIGERSGRPDLCKPSCQRFADHE